VYHTGSYSAGQEKLHTWDVLRWMHEEKYEECEKKTQGWIINDRILEKGRCQK